MAAKVHFQKVYQSEGRIVASTQCDRLDADIKSSQFRTDVTCKLCLRLLKYEDQARASKAEAA